MQWQQLETALSDLPEWNGRIVIDATNPIIQPGFNIANLGGRTSSQVFADFVPGARVVKAYNTLTPGTLGSNPITNGGHRVIFISGDDIDAKEAVTHINNRVGFATVDLGDLATGGKL